MTATRPLTLGRRSSAMWPSLRPLRLSVSALTLAALALAAEGELAPDAVAESANRTFTFELSEPTDTVGSMTVSW